MNIVIPMAGAGSRFSKAGFKIPKPLIDVQGKPMYQWATNSLPLEYASRLIFILREDAFTDQIIEDIHKTYGMFEPRIKILENLTRGQAETVYLARDMMDLNQPTLIHNADTAFQSMEMPDEDVFGGLVVFESALNDARWSFARTHDDQPDRVVEVREKQIISRLASTGTYYFSDTAWMLYSIKHSLMNDITEQGEFYIAPLYNRAIENGHYIQCLNCEHFTCLGTPEELESALPRMPLLMNSQITQIAV
jgi:UDP-N-acetylglucosamine diphosphorylase / glucose-1-phosphate thymidylyltransferase / UDP-N-acetylgalactosamine diphosphorylase / glucosamine-1-phosphate N-acetyltransferase / galactosamine-1-phosphate N-acetyltransferase